MIKQMPKLYKIHTLYKPILIYIAVFFLSSKMYAQDLDILKYFFVTPTELDKSKTTFSVNINSDYFSKDSFLFYSNIIDSVCRYKLNNGALLPKTEILNFEKRLGVNLMYQGFYIKAKN